jgi:Fur family ferric uptake transcriptional regulator/Fur family peroxide stress response transcriptional regulator
MGRLSQRQLDLLVRTRGLRLTPQRRAIVEFLENSHAHPTADEVFTAVNRRFPMTSKATVYNTLNLLKEADLVREVFKDGAIRYDPNLAPHHHFLCRRCGRIDDIAWDLVPPFPLGRLPGNPRVDSVELTLRGLCAACRKAS